MGSSPTTYPGIKQERKMSEGLTLQIHNLNLLILVIFFILGIRKVRDWLFIFLIPGFPEDGVIRIPIFFIWYVPLFTREEWRSLEWQKLAKLILKFWELYVPSIYFLLERSLKAAIQFHIMVTGQGIWVELYKLDFGWGVLKIGYFADFWKNGITLMLSV